MLDNSPIESPWTFADESTHLGENVVTLVDGASFVVCDRSGDITPNTVNGLFMIDTRVLSTWRLRLNGSTIEPLSVSTNGPFSATFVGRVRHQTKIEAPISVVQRRHVGRGMREDFDIRNYSNEPISLRVELEMACDFASLFDVKSGVAAEAASATVETDGGLTIIAAEDGTGRSVDATKIYWTATPTEVVDSRLVWNIVIEPGQRWLNCLLVGVVVEGVEMEPSYGCGEAIEHAIPVSRLRQWRDEVMSIDCDWPILTSAVDQASEDLGALRIFDPDHPDRVVVAAGAPWYMTLFGRDSLLTSWMALPLDHALARGVLRQLAESQGQVVEPTTEEQPGRILHEVRFDTATSRLLGGNNTYYGSIDATPLFVMLVAELAGWTGITTTVEQLMPAVDRAMAWIVDYGDRDGDGFVEYLRSDPSGLENQGWKDSGDGIRHLDGSIPTGPIALCEVQGYVYAAYRSRSRLARALGQPQSLADEYDAKADQLRQSFDDHFWVDEHGWYAVGLDGDKAQIASLTSNIGHLLWTGIVPGERASQVADKLVDPALFSGWGLRTLAENSAGYNPLSYHCGSVWPHDTALAVAGLARYGCDEQAQLLVEGLLAVSTHSGGRLPELFGGFGSDDLPAPVPYPASCSPQAWSAASPLLLVRAMLGLNPDLLTSRVGLRPRLGNTMTRIQLRQIPIGNNKVDIAVNNGEVEVTGLDSTIRLEIE